jgi:hypothetical protein
VLPASLILTEQGRRVGSLGPGLACESADARSGCPANRSAGRGPLDKHNSIDLKLFEPKTMCPVIAVRDREGR